jgi:hypothetical protein
MNELKLFDQLPKDYKEAVNHIVEAVLGDDWPDMNEAFRVWQAEIFLAGALKEDGKPDLKLFEIEALAFRGGWERRERISGMPS